MIDGFDDIKTIEVAPYFICLDGERRRMARKILQAHVRDDWNADDPDVTLERIWNALVGNK
jgi:hypothetical protein